MINYTSYKIEPLIDFCLTYLGIGEVEIIVYHNNKLLDKFSSADLQIDALLHKNSLEHTYNLIIRDNPMASVNRIICHEMIHLQQYEQGRLNLDLKNQTFYWDGKPYKNIPYNQRE